MLIALIPAYNPIASLPEYIEALQQQKAFTHIVVVNDGSLPRCDSTFEKISELESVILLKHAINRGKGAALKTGLNFIACKFPQAAGVVTIDADGQHTVKDACAIAASLSAHPEQLIIGGRRFDEGVPMRSLLGNFFTRHFFRLMIGLRLFDTQSGLRGIPQAMIGDLLKIEANGYEFELDMLVYASHRRIPILEVPIDTVYLDGNKHSSFSPLWDSLKIYFVLFRFSIIAVLSALLDYGIFIFVYYLVHPSVLLALTCGRIVSVTFNYLNVRHYAFRTHISHRQTLPKYLLLACFSGAMAWLLISGLINMLGWHVIAAKIMAEVIMFVVNFLIQRDFIFKRSA